MKTALYLTLARLVILPLFVCFYLYHSYLGVSFRVASYLLIVLFALCELSDLFDGFFARRADEVTDLGKVLDPMADSIVRLSVLMAFTGGVVKLPIWLVLVFLYRDSIIGTLRTLCALGGFTLAARLSGKIKAVLQAGVIFFILILLTLYGEGVVSERNVQKASFYVVLLVAIYTLFSGIEYLYANRLYIQKGWTKRKV